MSTIPPEHPDEDFDDEDDASDDFLREVARVEDRRPPSAGDRVRLEGTNIGRFKVVSEIGRGGMGIVLLAEDDKLRRKVALKLLPPSFAADEERRRRFFREARAAAAVSHPNLVTVYDVGEHEGRAYIAMEYLRGRSLRELMAERQLSVDEAVDLARQILAGLGHAHAAGLLHRDLKPENVLVEKEGRVRLVDFGLAKLDGDTGGEGGEQGAGTAGTHATRDGLVMGTPGYMSPEQARGQAVDARSDIFSFGVLFFEMLSRKRPFTGPSRADVVTSLLRDPAQRVDVLRPEVGFALGEVVDRCLAKSPDDRHASVKVLEQALEDAWVTSKREQRTVPTPTPASGGAPPVTPRRRLLAYAAPAFGLAAAIALALTMRPLRNPSPVASAAAAASADGGAGAKKGLAITDIPLPRSNSPQALAEYRQALQSIRDADWANAEEHLDEAVKADAELGAAHLRLAIIGGTNSYAPLKARAALSRAMTLRGTLSERDQLLMMAMEPIVMREPPDSRLFRERMKALLETHPDDAELWHYLADFGAGSTALEAARKAVTIDPQFADAWQVMAQSLTNEGRTEEAFAAIEHCMSVSPLSPDCLGERAHIYGMLGDCARMDEDLRRSVTSSSRAAHIWHEARAAALVATGKSDDAVLEAFHQKWSVMPDDDKRRALEALERAHLLLARGRFAEAEAQIAIGEKAVADDPVVLMHKNFAGLRVLIDVELGKSREAAQVAQKFLAKRDAWIPTRKGTDIVIPLLRVMQRGGLTSASELTTQRDAWYAKTVASGQPLDLAWTLGWGVAITTPAEAKEAIRTYETISSEQPSGKLICRDPQASGTLGHAYLLAGQPHEALAPLEKTANNCSWMWDAIEHTWSLVDLGKTHEALGNTEHACEAYQRVIARWAAAPRSVSRDFAKARVKALGCGTEAQRAPMAMAAATPVPAPAAHGPGGFDEAEDALEDARLAAESARALGLTEPAPPAAPRPAPPAS
ncbi:MAG: uncharacterized protein JWP97_3251, partial [Labilithrix sp.]|nr:uncharacterized protein [Labilithrix sp.]